MNFFNVFFILSVGNRWATPVSDLLKRCTQGGKYRPSSGREMSTPVLARPKVKLHKPPKSKTSVLRIDSYVESNEYKNGTKVFASKSIDLGNETLPRVDNPPEAGLAYSEFIQEAALDVFGSPENPQRRSKPKNQSYFRKQVILHSSNLVQKVKPSKSETFRSLFSRGYAYSKLLKNNEALEDYSKAVTVITNSAPAYYNRAEIFTRLNRFQDAVTDLCTAINLDPDGPNSLKYYNNRALVYRKINRFDLATNDYSSILELKKKKGSVKLVIAGDSIYPIPIEMGMSQLAKSLQIKPNSRSEDLLDEIGSTLSLINTLKSAPIGLLRDIGRLATYSKVTKSCAVFNEGDVSNGMYVLLSGKLSVSKKRVHDTSHHLLVEPEGVEAENVTVATLHPGALFGEVGQTDGCDVQLRRATIFVEEDAELLVFDLSNAETQAIQVLHDFQRWQIADRKQVIRQCSIFEDWTDEMLETLASECSDHKFTPGAIIVPLGEKISNLIVLKMGVCTVIKSCDVSDAANQPLTHPVNSRNFLSLKNDAISTKFISCEGPQKGENWVDFEVATLTGGQVANELAVLELAKEIRSPVRIVAVTNVDMLVISSDQIARIKSLFYGKTMHRLTESFVSSNKSAYNVKEIYLKQNGWSEKKKKIVFENIRMNNRLQNLKSF